MTSHFIFFIFLSLKSSAWACDGPRPVELGDCVPTHTGSSSSTREMNSLGEQFLQLVYKNGIPPTATQISEAGLDAQLETFQQCAFKPDPSHYPELSFAEFYAGPGCYYYENVLKTRLAAQVSPGVDPADIVLSPPPARRASGAMIYLIRNRKTHNTLEAIKLLEGSRGAEEVLSILGAERKMQELLKDDQFIKTRQVGKILDPNGQAEYFIAQDGAPGEDLDRMLREVNQSSTSLTPEEESLLARTARLFGDLHLGTQDYSARELTPTERKQLFQLVDYDLKKFDKNFTQEKKVIYEAVARQDITAEQAHQFEQSLGKIGSEYRKLTHLHPDWFRPTFSHGDAHGGNVFFRPHGDATFIDYSTLVWSIGKHPDRGISDPSSDVTRVTANFEIQAIKSGSSVALAHLQGKFFMQKYKEFAHLLPGTPEDRAFNAGYAFHRALYFGLQANDFKGVKFNSKTLSPTELRHSLFHTWLAGDGTI